MFRERIRDNYEHLSPGFRRLADFIVDHTLDAAFLTATELGRRVSVDPATVVRFAQDLGYSGYRELSAEIKSYVHDQIAPAESLLNTPSTPGQRLALRLSGYCQWLEQLTPIDFERLAEMSAVLDNARAIWIVAEGSVADLARGFAAHLCNLGLAVTVIQPNLLEAVMRLSHMQAADALLVLGGEGPQIDGGHIASIARDKGVRTLCISGHGLTAAAQKVDIALMLSRPLPSPSMALALTATLLSLVVECLESLRPEHRQRHEDEQNRQIARLMELRSEGLNLPGYSTIIWSRQLGWTDPASDS